MAEMARKSRGTAEFPNYAPNRTLAAVVDGCLQEVGAPKWTEEDYRLAAQFLQTYPEETRREMSRDLEDRFTPAEMAGWQQRPLDDSSITGSRP